MYRYIIRVVIVVYVLQGVSIMLFLVWSSVILLSIVRGQHLPTFVQNLTVLEERPRGTIIGQISVTSAMPPYTIYHAEPQDSGRILVSRDGLVRVGDRVDRETKSIYRLIAHASNNVNIEVNSYDNNNNNNNNT